MTEPKSRGVLDTPHARGMTAGLDWHIDIIAWLSDIQIRCNALVRAS
jgi:hypothetical protein